MFQIIMHDMLRFFYLYVGKGSVFALYAFFLTLIFGKFFIKYNEEISGYYIMLLKKAVIMAALSLYIYIVLGITLMSRKTDSYMHINLQLFSSFDKTLVAPKYLYENIIMLIPFAILLYMLASPFRSIGISLLIGFFFSFAIECVQLVTRLGSFMVDDIWTNTLGMLIGFSICRLVSTIWNTMRKQKYGLSVI